MSPVLTAGEPCEWHRGSRRARQENWGLKVIMERMHWGLKVIIERMHWGLKIIMERMFYNVLPAAPLPTQCTAPTGPWAHHTFVEKGKAFACPCS